MQKKGISAYQVSRNTRLRRGTCWSIMHRIRKAMEDNNDVFVKGIFEMDETYIKADKEKDEDDDKFGSNMGCSIKK